MRLILFVLVPLTLIRAEVRTLTLRETAALALKQNPDIALARLDTVKARESIRAARDPFVPKLFGGSGLAYTSGFPNSIEGSAPSIFTAKAPAMLFNKPQSYQVAAANENLRGSQIQGGVKQDEVVYRAAVLFLDAEQIGRALRTAEGQIANLERVRETIERRVAEGRELEIEKKRAVLNVLKARQRIENLRMDLDSTETALALILGYDAVDQVRPAEQDRPALVLPPSEEASITLAVDSSKDLKVLASRMAAKRLELAGFRAQRLPQLDLVAQYSLFAKYNYQNYFGQFQRHNGQIGVAVTIPILVGRSAYANAASAEADLAKLQIDFGRTRSQISADTKKAFQDLKKAELAGEVARADLDLTREQLSIYLAQYEEGRIPVAKLEETRIAESERWMSYYEAQNMMERARLAILRQTGTLQAALR